MHNSYLAFSIFLFCMTTLLQLSVNKGWEMRALLSTNRISFGIYPGVQRIDFQKISAQNILKMRKFVEKFKTKLMWGYIYKRPSIYIVWRRFLRENRALQVFSGGGLRRSFVREPRQNAHAYNVVSNLHFITVVRMEG